MPNARGSGLARGGVDGSDRAQSPPSESRYSLYRRSTVAWRSYFGIRHKAYGRLFDSRVFRVIPLGFDNMGGGYRIWGARSDIPRI